MKKKEKPKFDWWIDNLSKNTSAIQGNAEEILKEVEKIKAVNNRLRRNKKNYSYTYTVDGIGFGKYSYLKNVSHAKIRRMIENGHTDTNIWWNLYPRRYCRVAKKMIPHDPGEYSAWNMDLDNTKFHSVDELIEEFKRRGVVVPCTIVPTGITNFHCLFMGPPGYWTQERRKKLLIQFAGISKMPNNSFDIKKAFAERGVDYHYSMMDRMHQQIRVPGSLKNKDSEQFVCKVWVNDGYNYQNPEDPHDKDQKPDSSVLAFPKRKEIVEENRRIATEIYEKSYDNIHKVLMTVRMRNGNRAKFADYLASNVTRLRRGNLNMTQQMLEKKFDIKQKTISRILKKLRDNNILKIKKRHVFNPGVKIGNKGTEYGFGPVLAKALGITDNKDRLKRLGNAKLVRTLASPYENIQSNNSHVLEDLRCAFLLGVSKSDFCKIAAYKQELAGISGQMTEKYIENSWENWSKNIFDCYTIPPGPLINTGQIMAMIDGDEDIELEIGRA